MPDTLPALQPLHERVLAGLSKVGIVFKSLAWQDATPSGLTPTQAQLLVVLRSDPADALGVSHLARRLAVSTPTVSDSLSALERKGLVRKTRGPHDQRAVLVRLTRKGSAVARRAAHWPDALLSAVDQLSPDEQRVFLRGLVKMIRSLQDRGLIPVARMCVTCRYFRPHVYPDPARPHHCAYVDAPFGDGGLRLDCLEHQPAARAQRAAAWSTFTNTPKEAP